MADNLSVKEEKAYIPPPELLILTRECKRNEDENRACLDKCCSPPRNQSCVFTFVFVIAAVVQLIIVVVLQAVILAYGGHGGPLPEYKHCLSDALQMAIDCSETANWTNVTIPSFGRDKPVYVGFIISLTAYNAMLCFYAIRQKHFFQVMSFIVINLLTSIYAGFEAWQFRPFGPNCTDMPIAGVLAIITVVVLFLCTLLFGLSALCIYSSFAWKVSRNVKLDQEMKRYYQWYEVVSSSIKAYILLTVVFSVAQLALLLTPENYEFWLTIVLLVVAIVAYFVVQLTIHNNSFTGYLAITLIGVVLIPYYAFKIWRFATKSCPICHHLTDSLDNEYKALEWLLETCIDKNATLDAETDRSIQFENLDVFASVNLIITIMVLVIFLLFWCCQPGEKLMKQFEQNPSWIVSAMCCRQGKTSLLMQIPCCKAITDLHCCQEIAQYFYLSTVDKSPVQTESNA